MSSGDNGKVAAVKGKNELKEEFITLRARGFSFRDIEEKLGISRSTLCNWANELEEEIARLEAIELDALYHQYYLTKKSRIELLGGLLERMTEEALSRDLSEISTDRLLELIIKYQEKLEDERVEIRLLSEEEVAALKVDRIVPKLDSSVREEIDNALLRYRAGMTDKDQFSRVISALRAKLQAKDQEELERKLARLESVLEGRDRDGH